MANPSQKMEKQLSASPSYHKTRVGFILASLGAVLLLCMMGLTIFDVIGRYIFNAPVKGAAELTGMLLCATIFLGLGAVSLAEDHVTVDLFTEKFPSATEPFRQALTGLLGGGILCVIGWRLWIYAAQIGAYGGSTTTLGLPLAPLGYFCAMCAFIGGVITVFMPLKRLCAKLL